MKHPANDFVRSAEATDIEAIVGLTRQLGYDLAVETIAANLQRILEDGDRDMLVLVVSGEVNGMVSVCRDFAITEAPFALLTAIVVDEKHRGQGLGRKLLDAVYPWAQSHGLRKVKLRTNMIRTEAHEFYMRNGFQALKDQRVFVKNLSDAYQ